MDYTEITETFIALLLETFIEVILLETAIVDEKFFISIVRVINLDEYCFLFLVCVGQPRLLSLFALFQCFQCTSTNYRLAHF